MQHATRLHHNYHGAHEPHLPDTTRGGRACARDAHRNVKQDTTILDAPLTALGKQQAARVPALIPDIQQSVQVILSSPLRRTLQTTSAAYAPAIARLGGSRRLVVLPQLQGAWGC